MQDWQRYGKYLNRIGLTWALSRSGWGYTALVHGNDLDWDTVGEGYAWTRYRALRKAFRHYLQQR